MRVSAGFATLYPIPARGVSASAVNACPRVAFSGRRSKPRRGQEPDDGSDSARRGDSFGCNLRSDCLRKLMAANPTSVSETGIARRRRSAIPDPFSRCARTAHHDAKQASDTGANGESTLKRSTSGYAGIPSWTGAQTKPPLLPRRRFGNHLRAPLRQRSHAGKHDRRAALHIGICFSADVPPVQQVSFLARADRPQAGPGTGAEAAARQLALSGSKGTRHIVRVVPLRGNYRLPRDMMR